MLLLSIDKFCFVFNNYAQPIGQNLFVLLDSIVLLTSLCSHTAVGMIEYQFSAIPMTKFLHI